MYVSGIVYKDLSSNLRAEKEIKTGIAAIK